MRDEPDAELVAALTRALATEAAQVEVSPDARAAVQARLDAARRRASR